MRLNLAFGVAMSALFAFAGGKPAKEPQSLNQGTDTVRIMSWNVRHCRGQDNKTNVKRVAERIIAENPDFAHCYPIGGIESFL